MFRYLFLSSLLLAACTETYTPPPAPLPELEEHPVEVAAANNVLARDYELNAEPRLARK